MLHWEAPKFSFNSPNQVAEWQAFCTRALDFLEALRPQGQPQGQEEANHRAGHQAEVDRPTEAHQGIPVTALHKTITGEDHHIEEDAPQLLIGIRPAI